MEMLVKVMDGVMLQFLWICHLIYNVFGSETKSATKLESINEGALARKNHIDKRHFIHLYTSPSVTGKPTCYMDVYQLVSPSDEEKLRIVCSKGVPNNTYLRHNQRHKSHLSGTRPGSSKMF